MITVTYTTLTDCIWKQALNNHEHDGCMQLTAFMCNAAHNGTMTGVMPISEPTVKRPGTVHPPGPSKELQAPAPIERVTSEMVGPLPRT